MDRVGRSGYHEYVRAGVRISSKQVFRAHWQLVAISALLSPRVVEPEDLAIIGHKGDLLVDIYTAKCDAYLHFTAMLNASGEGAQSHRNDCSIRAVEVRNLTRNTHFSDFFDVDEDDVEKEKCKIVRAFKYTQLIASTLVDQFGNMVAKDFDAITIVIN